MQRYRLVRGDLWGGGALHSAHLNVVNTNDMYTCWTTEKRHLVTSLGSKKLELSYFTGYDATSSLCAGDKCWKSHFTQLWQGVAGDASLSTFGAWCTMHVVGLLKETRASMLHINKVWFKTSLTNHAQKSLDWGLYRYVQWFQSTVHRIECFYVRFMISSPLILDSSSISMQMRSRSNKDRVLAKAYRVR